MEGVGKKKNPSPIQDMFITGHRMSHRITEDSCLPRRRVLHDLGSREAVLTMGSVTAEVVLSPAEDVSLLAGILSLEQKNILPPEAQRNHAQECALFLATVFDSSLSFSSSVDSLGLS